MTIEPNKPNTTLTTPNEDGLSLIAAHYDQVGAYLESSLSSWMALSMRFPIIGTFISTCRACARAAPRSNFKPTFNEPAAGGILAI